jgi:GH25 family lysozyme M1 (1,4-beta-N-acetylmuramidase)
VTIFFPDVSHWKAGIDLTGAVAVMAKATEGTSYVDPSYAGFKAQAASHGSVFVAYHFLLAGNAAAQAAFAYSVVGDTPLCVDVETRALPLSNPSMADLLTFVDTYRSLGGTVWLVYLPSWYWAQAPFNRASLQPLIDRGLLLWSSHYVAYSETGIGWNAYGGMTPTIYQYSCSTPFGNQPLVDFSAYKGTIAEFTLIVSTGRASMARYPGAQWRPITVNYNTGGCVPRLLVLHIMQGTLAGTDSWFRNTAAQASAHFGVGKDGTVYQWVDTANKAWHAANANGISIGVEHEGNTGDSLTAAQVAADIKLYAWVHQHHAVPLALATSATGSGLAYHALGGASWGGHPDCPGAPIIAQRGAILAGANLIINPPPPPPPPPTPVPVPIPLLEDGENMIVVTRKNGIKDVFAVNSNVGYHQAVNAAGVPTNNDTLAGAWGYFFSAFWDTTQTVLTVFGVGSTGGVFKLVWSVAGNGWSVAPISVLP